jgi:hypothetical protein
MRFEVCVEQQIDRSYSMKHAKKQSPIGPASACLSLVFFSSPMDVSCIDLLRDELHCVSAKHTHTHTQIHGTAQHPQFRAARGD